MNNIKYNIALLGGRGFVGQEIIKILGNHSCFDLYSVFSSSKAGNKVDNYIKNPDLRYSNLKAEPYEKPFAVPTTSDAVPS